MTRPIVRDSRATGMCRKARRRTVADDVTRQNIIVVGLLVLLGLAVLMTRLLVGL